MLKRALCLCFFFSMSFLTHADDQLLEEELMGAADLDEETILEPLSADDKLYLDSLSDKNDEKTDPLLEDANFPEIDFDEVNKITQKRNKVLNQVIKSVNKRNLNYAEKEALKVQLKDIIHSGTFVGSIRKRTHLVHIKTGKTYYAPKDLTVRAFRLKDYEGYLLLLNKNGYVTYKAPASEVVNIKEVVKMHEPPEYYHPIVKKIEYDRDDTQLKIESQFLLNMGLTRPIFLRDLINDKNHFGQTIRYEFSNYGHWDFPLKLGLTAQWENNFGNFNNGKYNMQSLSIGPAFKTDSFTLWGKQYTFVAQTRLSVFSNIALTIPAGTINYHTTQTSLVLGLSRELKTSMGTFIIGANYQRQWIQASAQQYELNISSTNNYNDSFVLSIGGHKDWIW